MNVNKLHFEIQQRTRNVGKYNGLFLKEEATKRVVCNKITLDKSFKENLDPEDTYNFSVFQPNPKKVSMLDMLVAEKDENPEKERKPLVSINDNKG